MPKTNEKDAYFFSHDCNARNDPKILALRSVYGAEGYAVYFMLIEILREQPDHKLPMNKYTFPALAMQMGVDASRLQNIINDCCTEFCDGENNSPLLVNDGKSLFSMSLLRRMGKVNEVSNIRREAALKRWENRENKPSAPTLQDTPKNANAEQKQSKEKERKEKEKENICIDANKEKSEKKKADVFADFAYDDEELLKALRDFEGMRRKIKKPMTDQAKRRLLTELRKLSSNRDEQIAILHQSEDHCWSGVFALHDNAPASAGGQRGTMATAEKMGALGALHQAFSTEGGGR